LFSEISGANPAQLNAIRHKDGPMMVIAGPGSGKTFVITNRLLYMIREHGIDPGKILVITFTKAAALQMEERALKLSEDLRTVTFGTFHAVYFGILRSVFHYGRENILSEAQKKNYLKEALGQLAKPAPDNETADRLLSMISRDKNSGCAPGAAYVPDAYLSRDEYLRLFSAYLALCKKDRRLDFDDMVIQCRDLFLTRPDLLNLFREKYAYILIDEFQDINPVQYEVIRLLAHPKDNLFIVGDDDQSIYAFRGAAPELMLHFPKDYPSASTVVLRDNYRSTANIVAASSRLISANKKRYPKRLKAGKNGSRDVSVFACVSREEELDTICRLVQKAAAVIPYPEIAILFRTNTQARSCSVALSRAGIPFYVRESIGSIYESPVGKDIQAVLAFVHGETSRENLFRFMNKPLRYIPRRILKEGPQDLHALAGTPGIAEGTRLSLLVLASDLDKIRDMAPYAAINYIAKGMGYEDHLIREAKERGTDPSDAADTLCRIRESASSFSSYREWLSGIRRYEEDLKSASSEGSDGVRLLTMHASKGLEYRVVLIPDINEGTIPQKNASGPQQIEEERRILYVGMTRAKEKLILLYQKKNLQQKILPSRFLKELKL